MKSIFSRPFSRMAKNNNQPTPKPESSSFVPKCIICSAAADHIIFTNSLCSHSLCTDCLSNHIAAKLDDNVADVDCPEPNCKAVIDPNACDSFLSKEVLDRWGDALSEAMILGMQRLVCPFVDCSAMLIDDGDEVVREAECPSCRRMFCAQCKVAWHGGMDCPNGESSSSPPQLTCSICTDTKTIAEMFENTVCAHSFCIDCMSQHVAAKVRDNIVTVKCPEPNCETVLDPNTCDWFLPKEVLDRWGDALCEAAIVGTQRFYCPFKDCSVMLIDSGGEVVREAECPSCRRMFCAQCRVGWHGEMECEEFQREGGKEDLIAKKFAERKKWKRCPNCKIYVEKIEGCAYIKCRCGTKFCYSCGAKWGGDHACAASAFARRYH